MEVRFSSKGFLGKELLGGHHPIQMRGTVTAQPVWVRGSTQLKCESEIPSFFQGHGVELPVSPKGARAAGPVTEQTRS